VAGSSPASVLLYRSLTQLDRVPVFETGSRGFESCRTGQTLMEIVMKTTMFKNIFNNEHFVCDDIRVTETIEGVEYLVVHRPNEHRPLKMRRDALVKINTPVTQRNKSTTLRR
jgi:hypothetical protein